MGDDVKIQGDGQEVELQKEPSYYCPRHGSVKGYPMRMVFDGKDQWCMTCFMELVDKSCHRAEDDNKPHPQQPKKW